MKKIFTLAFIHCLYQTSLVMGNYEWQNSSNTGKTMEQAYHSGLEGITHFKVMSGMPDGQHTIKVASIEFAIAPMENGIPLYDQSIFVKSDKEGKYHISLPPGKYWIGPKGKALDPDHYFSPSFSFEEKEVVIKEGAITSLDLLLTGYAS
jgi:hypothetical protein